MASFSHLASQGSDILRLPWLSPGAAEPDPAGLSPQAISPGPLGFIFQLEIKGTEMLATTLTGTTQQNKPMRVEELLLT